MSEMFELSFTVPQIEALIKALERGGVNTGTTSDLLATFGDPTFVSAAQGAHRLLRSKVQRQARGKSSSEPIRELTKDSALADLRSANRSMRNDYHGLLAEVDELLKAATIAQRALETNVAHHRNTADILALSGLTNALDRAWFSDSAIANKLAALEAAKE